MRGTIHSKYLNFLFFRVFRLAWLLLIVQIEALVAG